MTHPNSDKVTVDMKQHIHESNLIEGYDNLEFDKQSMVAWRYLIKQDHLNVSVICKVQKIITLLQDDLQPDERGYMRKVNVYIGGHAAPNPEMMRHEFHNWLIGMQIPEDKDPKRMHQWFEHIHPFVDGNGRTGRMLMWWHELKLGTNPTLILNSQKQDYYKWFAQDDRLNTLFSKGDSDE
jgi:Fic family protein